MGALYLQQCVCVLPDTPAFRDELAAVRTRVVASGGSSNLFEIPALPAEEEEPLVAGFRDLVAQQYAEIIEECETKFVKEVEFEHFRQNYTFAEAEEIEQDLEKIRRWYDRVQTRDWFAAPGRDVVEERLSHCSELLEEFFAVVHARSTEQTVDSAEPAAPSGPSRLATVPPLDARSRNTTQKRRAGRPRP